MKIKCCVLCWVCLKYTSLLLLMATCVCHSAVIIDTNSSTFGPFRVFSRPFRNSNERRAEDQGEERHIWRAPDRHVFPAERFSHAAAWISSDSGTASTNLDEIFNWMSLQSFLPDLTSYITTHTHTRPLPSHSLYWSRQKEQHFAKYAGSQLFFFIWKRKPFPPCFWSASTFWPLYSVSTAGQTCRASPLLHHPAFETQQCWCISGGLTAVKNT